MSDLKISIIGYGKMGKEIESLAPTRKIEVVSVIDPVIETLSYMYKYETISRESVKNADVCIEFTNSEVVMDNIRKLIKLKKNVVVGTTGWYEDLDEVRELVKSSGIGLIYSSNFSVGANIYFAAVESLLKISKSKGYDLYGIEQHHKEKKDKPSGTAKTLEKIAMDITGEKLEFVSLRAGKITGTHTVGLDSEYDLIELTHSAKNRGGFALGALLAAEFIAGKKGFYGPEDFRKYLFGGRK